MPLDDLMRELPADAGERVLVALDCANRERIGQDTTFVDEAPLTVNIDHHQDNTRFGDVNVVVADASSTSEVLRDLLAELDVKLTPEIAEALYVALVTDTGRFAYTNTTAKAFRLAAELVDAGADVHRVFQVVYESIEFAKLKLLARVLERAQVYEGGRLVVSYILRSDFTELNAPEAYSEGLIDYAARGRGRGNGRTDPRAAAGRPARTPREPAREHGRARRLRHRPQVGRGRPPPGGGLLQRRLDRGDHAVHPRRVRTCRPGRLARAGCS